MMTNVSAGGDVTESQYFTLIIGGATGELDIQDGVVRCKIRDLLGMSCHELALVSGIFPNSASWLRVLPPTAVTVTMRSGEIYPFYLPSIEYYWMGDITHAIQNALPDHLLPITLTTAQKKEREERLEKKQAVEETGISFDLTERTLKGVPVVRMDTRQIRKISIDPVISYVTGLPLEIEQKVTTSSGSITYQKPVLLLGCDGIEFSTIGASNYYQLMAAIQLESNAFTYQPQNLQYNKITKYNSEEVEFYFKVTQGSWLKLYKGSEIVLTFHVRRTCPFV